MGTRCKLIHVLILVCFTFINVFVFGKGDKGEFSTSSPCDLCPEDYSLVASCQNIIKTKNGSIQRSIHGEWIGTALIQGQYNGHSCFNLKKPDMHLS